MSISYKVGYAGEQIKAHDYLRKELAQRLGVAEDKFPEKSIKVNDSFMKFTALSKSPNIVCEASAHIGIMKSAQIHKIMNNALKMIFLEDHLKQPYRKILAFIDDEAASKFVGSGWHGECLRRYEIEVMTLHVPEHVKKAVTEAQKEQYR